MGLQNFRTGQLEVISAILNGNDTCVFWSTGSGKSVCFQLPAIHTKKLVIIVSPLISLINDQVKGMNKRFGREIAMSFAAANATPDTMEKIKSGEGLLCYCTPERLSTPSFITHMQYIHNNVRSILLLAVDEAHFVSQQGFDFRPSYRNISLFREAIPNIPLLALTATAPPHIRHDIISTLQMHTPQIFTSSYDKPNLSITVKVQKSALSVHDIVRECSSFTDGSMVVFTYTRKDAEKLHLQITQRGKGRAAQSALLYHGQLDYTYRENVQRWFNDGQIKIVVATGSSFGTGIDKGDIRKLIIYGMPKTFEDFYQQIGRAGRDGANSIVKVFVAKNDYIVHLFRDKGKGVEHQQMANNEKRSLFKLKAFLEDRSTCRRLSILRYWGQGELGWKCGDCDNCKKM
eukprot:3747689-Rhodomonas_salina.2